MKSVNVTVRLDEEIKKEFDSFCDNVGINITTAFNMFIKATLRNRALPFTVSDSSTKQKARKELKEAFSAAQRESAVNGTDNMTLDEINDIIAESRPETGERQEQAGNIKHYPTESFIMTPADFVAQIQSNDAVPN